MIFLYLCNIIISEILRGLANKYLLVSKLKFKIKQGLANASPLSLNLNFSFLKLYWCLLSGTYITRIEK